MNEQPLPQDQDAEESVLGVMLQSEKAVTAVMAEGLKPDDFYVESNGKLFAAMTEMFDKGIGIDRLTVAAHLGWDGQEQRAVIAALAHAVPQTGNAVFYARRVKEQAVARRIVEAGHRIVRIGYEQPEMMVAAAEEALYEAAEDTEVKKAESIADGGLDELIEQLREAVRTGNPIQGRQTGLKALDGVLNGLWDGQLIIVAARPSQGKSAFALNVAENFADRGETVLFVSLEMSLYELRVRSLSRASRLDGMRLQRAELDGSEQKKLAEGIMRVRHKPKLFIQDSGASSVATLRAEAMRLKRQEGLSLIVVDYLQLMQGPGDTRNEEVGQISRALKLLARQLDIPIIALAQMNRAIESRGEKRPMLSDLRDSGSLEQDGDVVIFLHDEAAYDTDAVPSGVIELIVAKQRKGACTTVKVAYNRAWNSFKDLGGS